MRQRQLPYVVRAPTEVLEQLEEVVELLVLQDVSGGPLLEPCLVVGCRRGQHHHLGPGRHLADPGEDLLAGDVGQPEVEHHDIGSQPLGEVDGVETRTRLAEHLEPPADPEGRAHHAQDVLGVVDQHDPEVRGRGGRILCGVQVASPSSVGRVSTNAASVSR